MAFRRVILYRVQSFLSPRKDLNFGHLPSCDTIESRLLELEQRITDTEADDIIRECKNITAELEQIHNHRANGIILRSKVRWYEEVEKSNKYFVVKGKTKQKEITYQKIS